MFDLIRVDLFDLNLAAEKISVDTGEDFVWRLLDISYRTMLATAELAGVELVLKWDDTTGTIVSQCQPQCQPQIPG